MSVTLSVHFHLPKVIRRATTQECQNYQKKKNKAEMATISSTIAAREMPR